MRLLLAVSGGADSIYLLHRAPELFPGASFAVAHCNFCLRGEESDGDEAFVRQECSSLGVECFVQRFNTLAFAAENGISVEMAARQLRYAWFAELCSAHGFDALVTAHNAGDNAETLILNLLRGTGSKGMRGIPAEGTIAVGTGMESGCASGNCGRPWPPPWVNAPWGATGGEVGDSREGPAPKAWEGRSVAEVAGGTTCAMEVTTREKVRMLRPLLGSGREEIREWLRSNGLRWREDSSNAENDARRNKIRNLVFPVFAQINPSFVKTLGEDMARIRQADDIADDYYRSVAAAAVISAPGCILQINVPKLLEFKHWRYALWRILEDCSFNAETFSKLCELLERYRTGAPGTVTLSGKTFESPTHLLHARRKNLVLVLR